MTADSKPCRLRLKHAARRRRVGAALIAAALIGPLLIAAQGCSWIGLGGAGKTAVPGLDKTPSKSLLDPKAKSDIPSAHAAGYRPNVRI